MNTPCHRKISKDDDDDNDDDIDNDNSDSRSKHGDGNDDNTSSDASERSGREAALHSTLAPNQRIRPR